MRNIEIELSPRANPSKVEKTIDAIFVVVGLRVSLRGTLKKFPGCIHSHARSAGQSGTLELTLWPQQHRAWISIQDGRNAEWIREKLTEIQHLLAK